MPDNTQETRPQVDTQQDSSRKKDHIDLALMAQTGNIDDRFYYEPLLAAHPDDTPRPVSFLNKQMQAPIWISSMTGGTKLAGTINKRLARVCHQFGIGMGLGSCRIILDSDEYFEDFNLRPIIGDALPFYANLGIAQVEQLQDKGEAEKIVALVDRLQADGLFVHVNPLQEWLQPEGDAINRPPLETIQQLLDDTNLNIIVKEVGQGMGPQSLKALFELPLAAVDFAAHGGTNFSKVELLRSQPAKQEVFENLTSVGHNAPQMVALVNEVLDELGDRAKVNQVLISGGIQNFLDGYWLMNKVNCPAIYGQGSAFLKRATESYEAVEAYTREQIRGLALAQTYLTVK